MSRQGLTFHSTSPDETAKAAARVAQELKIGDAVLLAGDVGAGKTHFARHLIQSILDVPEDVPSPTFTLVQVYETQRGALWHSDLYRITSVFEIEELGLTEAFETAICLVEWPDRLGELKPQNALTLTFSQGDAETHRDIVATWEDPRWDTAFLNWGAS